jgi:hypothetical protein
MELKTDEMVTIDREIRNRFDRGDRKVTTALEGVYDRIVEKGGMNEVRIYGGNRYWVISTKFWGRHLCVSEGLGDGS